MKLHVMLCVFAAALTGCQRSVIEPPSESDPALALPLTTQVIIVEGFGDKTSIVAGQNGVRVGWYYDFSRYDSLRINFSAQRVGAESPCDHILIKIGPGFSLRDSLSALKKDFSLHVPCADLAKRHFAALTFYVPDPDVDLVLSDLRIVGWFKN
jgi:hypothetical protein